MSKVLWLAKRSYRIISLAAALAAVVMLSGCGFFGANINQPPVAVDTNKVVKAACSQIGKKYKSGGSSPQKGFDCSGLVWWSYNQNGVAVPRTTTEQAKAGRAVAKKNAKAGDIVVFRTSRSPRGLHTGLYCGQDSFVHSPSSGKKVCIEKISTTHWKDKLIAVRRIGK